MVHAHFGPKPHLLTKYYIGREYILFTVSDLGWPLTSMKVTAILNLNQLLFWPSLVAIEHCLLLWPLLTFDLREGHHLPKLASAIFLTKFGSHRSLFTIFDLCWPLTSMKVTVILNLNQLFFWPSLVAIEHCLLLWPLLTFDLCEGHHLPKLASAIFLTKFGSHRSLFTIFDLCWPLTSMKVTVILNLNQLLFWPSLVAIEHCLSLWLLLTFDLREGHHLPKLASAIFLTKFGSHRSLFTIFDLCWPLTSMKVTVILNLNQPLFWPSLVAIEHCLSLWPLLTFDLREGHHLPKLASAIFLTKFGSHRSLFTIFDLGWPLTSMKVTAILNLNQLLFWPSLVAIEHCLSLWPLLTFDLREGHHLPKLASAIFLTKFGSHRSLFTMFDLCWPLTSMKVPIILNLHQQFLWPSLVAM